MAESKAPATGTIDITTPGSGYEVRPGVGPVIAYHGASWDLRSLTKAQAEQIANDPGARYVTKTAATASPMGGAPKP